MSAAYLKGPPDVLPSVGIFYGCVGKTGFESAVLAIEVAGRSRGGVPLDVYRCNKCGLFHLGRSLKKNGSTRAAQKELIR